MGDKGETSVNSRGPRHPDRETRGRQGGDKAHRVGDKGGTSVNSCGPRHPEWDASRETEAKSCGPEMQPF